MSAYRTAADREEDPVEERGLVLRFLDRLEAVYEHPMGGLFLFAIGILGFICTIAGGIIAVSSFEGEPTCKPYTTILRPEDDKAGCNGQISTKLMSGKGESWNVLFTCTCDEPKAPESPMRMGPVE